MIKYGDLVQYIKNNHVNWNTDLFDVLRGFFDSYNQKYSPPPTPSKPPVKQPSVSPWVSDASMQTEHLKDWQEPANGEYNTNDLINLFST